jgi:hypothetical protein
LHYEEEEEVEVEEHINFLRKAYTTSAVEIMRRTHRENIYNNTVCINEKQLNETGSNESWDHTMTPTRYFIAST